MRLDIIGGSTGLRLFVGSTKNGSSLNPATDCVGPSKPRLADRRNESPANRVRQVIMLSRRMINHVTPAARGAPLQPAELRNQARAVEQRNVSAFQLRQNVAIKLGTCARCDAICDAMPSEGFARPFATVSITLDR